MSRNMHMQGARKIKFEDISFESDTHNIYDPFYSSESDDGDDYSNTSDEMLSDYDSESQSSSRSSQGGESSFSSADCRSRGSRRGVATATVNHLRNHHQFSSCGDPDVENVG